MALTAVLQGYVFLLGLYMLLSWRALLASFQAPSNLLRASASPSADQAQIRSNQPLQCLV